MQKVKFRKKKKEEEEEEANKEKKSKQIRTLNAAKHADA